MRQGKLMLLAVAAAAMLLLAACGQKSYEPLAINEETDICVICNMQVKDDAFATQIVTKDGQSLKFDDIGCMNEWKTRNGTGSIGMDYVRDYNDKEWIEYAKAAYVYDSSLRTPMAYGVISFKDTASAEAFVAEQGVGEVLTAEQLGGHAWTQNTDMMHMGDGHNHDEHGDHGHEDGGHGSN